LTRLSALPLQVETIKALAAMGKLDVNLKDANGCTPIFFAQSKKCVFSFRL